MLLALDIGNSSISLGLFDLNDRSPKPTPLMTAKLSATTGRTADEYAVIIRGLLSEQGYATAVEAAVMGSVVPQLTHTLEAAVRKLSRAPIPVTHIGGGVRTGVSLRVDDPAALGAGPGLMFGVLPQVFERMPGGGVIGFVFFVTVFLAALTSSISLMETVVSTIMDKFKLDRKLCCAIVLGISLLLGIPSSLGYSAWSGVEILGMQILDFFDFISNSVIMPLVALLTSIFVGYFLTPHAVIEEVELSGEFKLKRLFSVMIRYVAPVCLVAVLASSVLDGFGIIKI